MSDLEAEYIALSQGMRELVSGRRLMIELTTRMDMLHMQGVSFVYKAWEDNTDTENLVNNKGPLVTSRTKHICIKYHWFRSMIQKNEIEVNRIDTKRQKAASVTRR